MCGGMLGGKVFRCADLGLRTLARGTFWLEGPQGDRGVGFHRSELRDFWRVGLRVFGKWPFAFKVLLRGVRVQGILRV